MFQLNHLIDMAFFFWYAIQVALKENHKHNRSHFGGPKKTPILVALENSFPVDYLAAGAES